MCAAIRFFKKEPINQDTIIFNYNEILIEFSRNLNLQKLNDEGICAGLTLNYLQFAAESGENDEFARKDEFYRYLEFIHTLDYEQSRMLGELYQQGKRNIPYTASFDKEESYINLDRLLEFVKVVNDAQKIQRFFKIIRANWDRTYLIFCRLDQLAEELRQARIRDGKFIHVSIGKHVFAIENTKNGFYFLFEPNAIERTSFATEEELAASILKNAESTFILANDNVALSLSFLSRGNKNREIDDLIVEFEGLLAKECLRDKSISSQLDGDLKRIDNLISRYRQGDLSRAELGLRMNDILFHAKDLPTSITKFNEKLFKLLLKTKILEDQIKMNLRLKDSNFVFGSAYVTDITSLYLAAAYNQVTILKQLITEGGADPNRIHVNGSTPLYMCAQKGIIDSAEALLETGAKWDIPITASTQVLIKQAKKYGREANVQYLLDSNQVSNSFEGFNSLHAAAAFGHLEIVLLLLKYGADPHCKTNGMSAIDFAQAMGHQAIVSALENRTTEKITM